MATTSAPNRIVRVVAMLSILLAGLCGGLIGYVVTDLQCHDGCRSVSGFVGVVSAIACASGVAVVVVLALRASAEWKAKEVRQRTHQESGTT